MNSIAFAREGFYALDCVYAYDHVGGRKNCGGFYVCKNGLGSGVFLLAEDGRYYYRYCCNRYRFDAWAAWGFIFFRLSGVGVLVVLVWWGVSWGCCFPLYYRSFRLCVICGVFIRFLHCGWFPCCLEDLRTMCVCIFYFCGGRTQLRA